MVIRRNVGFLAVAVLLQHLAQDCRITVATNALQASAGTHPAHSGHESAWHIMERAADSLQRSIDLPRNSFADKAGRLFKRVLVGEYWQMHVVP